MDEAKGRIKAAVGDLTDNDDLKKEGNVDQAGATVKNAAEKVADKAGEAVDKATDRMTGN